MVAVTLTLFSVVWAQAVVSLGDIRHGLNSQPFSRILVFGDTLLDTPNFYRLSGGFPPTPHFQGRFSNGRIWVEPLPSSTGCCPLHFVHHRLLRWRALR
jgi:hypothetical protein